MFIKSITIRGFRSFKDETIIPDLDRGLNVIVGTNGSGKSNVFFALRFIFSPDMKKISVEERKDLIHDSHIEKTLSASVTVVLGTTDSENDGKDIEIKRSMGLKKDEYIYNQTKIDFDTLLFNLKLQNVLNNQFIVKQDEINRIGNMNGKERFDLVKNLAGLKIFDEKKAEAMDKIKKNELRIDKINQQLESMEDDLKGLEKEKKYYEEYKELKSKKNHIEKILLNRRNEEVQEKLINIEIKQKNETERLNVDHVELMERKNELRDLELEIETLEQGQLDLKQQEENLLKELSEVINEKSEQTHNINILTHNKKNRKKDYGELKSQEDELLSKCKGDSDSLEIAKSKLEVNQRENSELNTELNEIEDRLKNLYTRIAFAEQYENMEERDEILNQKIGELRVEGHKLKRKINEINEEITMLDQDKLHAENELNENVQVKEEISTKLMTVKQQMNKNDLLLKENTHKFKEISNRKQKVEFELQKPTKHLKKLEEKLLKTLNSNLRKGYLLVKKLVYENSIPGVLGPLFELFEPNSDELNIAIDVIAQNQLFHIVIEDDSILDELIPLLKNEDVRISFIPLNQLRNHDDTDKKKFKGSTEEAIPLIDCLNFDKKIQAAMEQIFGNVLLVRHIDIATEIINHYSYDCVTIQGDRINKNGELRGGYIDFSNNRMSIIQDIKSEKKESNRIKKAYQRIENEYFEIENDYINSLNAFNDVQNRYASLEKQLNDLEKNILAKEDYFASIHESIKNYQSTKNDFEEKSLSLKRILNNYQSLLGKELEDVFTNEERIEIENLKSKKSKINNKLINLSLLINENILLIDKLEMNLSVNQNNLRICQNSLKQDYSIDLIEEKEVNLNSLLSIIENRETNVRNQLNDLRNNKTDTINRLNEIDAIKSNLEITITDLESNYENNQSKLDLILDERASLLNEEIELNKSIRHLPAIFSTEDEEKDLEKKNKTYLEKELNKLNRNIEHSEMNKVNLRAIQQYAHYIDETDRLTKTLTTLQSSYSELMEFIQDVENQRLNSFERTFLMVKLCFQCIFRQLVPNGISNFVLQYDESVSNSSVSDSQIHPLEQSQTPAPTSFDGNIEIIVSFPNDRANSNFTALSGGQKGIVSVALILAMQRCVTAPFYCFDEVDAHLDSWYRDNVALLLKKFSVGQFSIIDNLNEDERLEMKDFYQLNGDTYPISFNQIPTQFIVSTFRNQFVQHASRCYLVSYHPAKKISNIRICSQEEAENIIING
eukprot:TRINITY_DN3028_c0_g1_i1.p1 TRINITY_DN3028_c0_g1~~TRINITY_DN3028_c0_g1_i1.p1  ORF type:complete len:1240 (+),score=297.93 TRINITY_DN3028_c0_g1_i1:2683-6402(+)